MKMVFAILLSCSIGVPLLAAAVTPLQQARIAAVFDDLHAGTPGCVAGVVQNGDLAYAHGFGMADIGQHVAMAPDTVLEIGSLSKQFTAASILMLADAGKLSLDDPVRKYLPRLPGYAESVTIRQLMHHTSGLRDVIGLMTASGIPVGDTASQEDALAMIYRQRHLNFPPDTEYEYSNSGYVLLAEIVEKVSGKPFAAFLAGRIFKPLGMTHSYLNTDPFKVSDHHARSYARQDDGSYLLADSHWVQVGDGAINTTVGDFARWVRNFKQPVVGGPSLVKGLLTRGVLANGRPIDYAGGLVVDDFRGLPRISHTGSWQGFRTAFSLFPQQHLGVVVLCNGAQTKPADRRRKVAEILLGKAMERSDGDAGAKDHVPAGDATPYLGFYRSGDHRQLWQVKTEDGRMAMGPVRNATTTWQKGRQAGSFADMGMTARFSKMAGGGMRLVLEPAGTVLVRHGPSDHTGVPARVRDALVGSYQSRALQVTWRVDDDGGRLYLEARGANPNRLDTNKRYGLRPLAKGVFEAGPYVLEFGKDQFWLFIGRASGVHFVRKTDVAPAT